MNKDQFNRYCLLNIDGRRNGHAINWYNQLYREKGMDAAENFKKAVNEINDKVIL